MTRTMSWEERYLEDLLPEIEDYVEEEGSSFTSRDIAERTSGYNPQEVGKTLKYMVKNGEAPELEMTGNNPKEWKMSEKRSLEELGDEELEKDPESTEKQGKEEIAEEVLEENPEILSEGLYGEFMERLKQYDRFNNTPESIEKMKTAVEQRRPEVNRGILDIGAQEYGKMRRNIDEVYEGLQNVKKERSGLFRTEHVEKYVEDMRPSEVGVVLSGLAAAGLLESYSDREGYVPDSVDLEEIQEFRRAVKNVDSIEGLRDFLTFDEKR